LPFVRTFRFLVDREWKDSPLKFFRNFDVAEVGKGGWIGRGLLVRLVPSLCKKDSSRVANVEGEEAVVINEDGDKS
jgi:hypothetical protein